MCMSISLLSTFIPKRPQLPDYITLLQSTDDPFSTASTWNDRKWNLVLICLLVSYCASLSSLKADSLSTKDHGSSENANTCYYFILFYYYYFLLEQYTLFPSLSISIWRMEMSTFISRYKRRVEFFLSSLLTNLILILMYGNCIPVRPLGVICYLIITWGIEKLISDRNMSMNVTNLTKWKFQHFIINNVTCSLYGGVFFKSKCISQ